MDNTQTKFSQSVESQESGKKKSGKVFDSNQHTETIKLIERKKEQNQFLQTTWEDFFFEIGFLQNEGNNGIMFGFGMESKSKNSYAIQQHCFDVIYYKDNFDFRWTPAVFLGNYQIKIGAGVPISIGTYHYTVTNEYNNPEDEFDLSFGIGVRPSVKLTIKNVSFEAYYQYFAKVFICRNTIKSNEFGLTLKFLMED